MGINKKHKFVADGIFFAELNALLTRELAEEGYSGVEVRTAPNKTQIIIKATRTKNVLGDKGRRIHELTAVIEKRFNFKPDQIALFAARVDNRALCATGHAVLDYVDTAVRHVMMRQGVLGIKVSIMLPYDPTGKIAGLPSKPLADVVTIIEPKEEVQMPITVTKKEEPVAAAPAPVSEPEAETAQ